MDEQTPGTQSELAALHAIVEGRVQGVGFRMFVQQTASGLDLTGWVRNRYNGNVEVWAEGSSQKLQDLITALRKGPPAATVIELNYRWKEPTGKYQKYMVIATEY